MEHHLSRLRLLDWYDIHRSQSSTKSAAKGRERWCLYCVLWIGVSERIP